MTRLVWPDYGTPGAPNMDPYYCSPAQVADAEIEHRTATDNLQAALTDAVASACKALSQQEVADALRQVANELIGAAP